MKRALFLSWLLAARLSATAAGAGAAPTDTVGEAALRVMEKRVMACLRCPQGSNPCAIPMRTHTISFGERIRVMAGWRSNRSKSAGREGRGKEAEAADRQLSKTPIPQPQH